MKSCRVCGQPGATECWFLWVCNKCFADWVAECQPPPEHPLGTLDDINAGWERVTKAYFRSRFASLQEMARPTASAPPLPPVSVPPVAIHSRQGEYRLVKPKFALEAQKLLIESSVPEEGR